MRKMTYPFNATDPNVATDIVINRLNELITKLTNEMIHVKTKLNKFRLHC